MAGLDPAIQCHTEFIGFFVDGPVKPGHDNWVFCGRTDFFTRSFAGMTPVRNYSTGFRITQGAKRLRARVAFRLSSAAIK
jgi:hypothetical protein